MLARNTDNALIVHSPTRTPRRSKRINHSPTLTLWRSGRMNHWQYPRAIGDSSANKQW